MILELREALLAAQSQFLEYPSVVGVAPDKDPETGEYRIAILIYHWQIEGPKSGQPTAMAWRQRIPNEFMGFKVIVREVNWELPDPGEEEDPCNPGRRQHVENIDFRYLDWGKVHQIHLEELKVIQIPAAPPRVRIDGEIIIIEDNGTLVNNVGALDYIQAWKIFRSHFGDDYDFVSFYIDRVHPDTNGNLLPGPGGAEGITIFNDIKGIHNYKGDNYNDRPAWQNSTKLLGYQAYSNSQWSLKVQLEELGHHWCAFVYHRDPVNVPTERDELHRDFSVSGQEIYHWGTWFDNDNSSIDYDSRDWVPAGPGQWNQTVVTDATTGYCNLDLYLIGVLDKSEVGTITYINNPTFNQAIGRYQGTPVNLTIDNITAHHGNRNPAYPNTQRVFHLAHVILTKDLNAVGDLLNGFVHQVEMNRRAFTQRFREATRGRAILDTSLLHPHYIDLYVRDNAADTGSASSNGTFWNSPDLWIRNADDDGIHHQNPIRGQNNYIYVRVNNRSSLLYEDVTVRVYLANFVGTQFRYPQDWNPNNLIGEQIIHVPAGGSAIAKILWPASAIPATSGIHPCLLAEVIPMETTPTGLHYVWENRKLCQKNITIWNIISPDIDLTGDLRPWDLRIVYPVRIGHPTNEATTPRINLYHAQISPELKQDAADGLLPRATSGQLLPQVEATPIPTWVNIFIDPKGDLSDIFEAVVLQEQCQTTLFIPSGTQIGVGHGPCAERPDGQVTFCDDTRISLSGFKDQNDWGFKGLRPVIIGGRRLLWVTDWQEASLALSLAAGEQREITLEVQLDPNYQTGKSLLFTISQSNDQGQIIGGVDLLVNT